jgi:hypothetical protein
MRGCEGFVCVRWGAAPEGALFKLRNRYGTAEAVPFHGSAPDLFFSSMRLSQAWCSASLQWPMKMT